MKGRYIFLEATDEEKEQSIMLEKGINGPRKIFWRLKEILPDSVHHGKLLTFHSDLVKFNQKINLVSKNSIFDADILHFLDSYLASEMILADNTSETIYDFGSGNGFPGLILALLAPERKVVLIDTDSRKIEFIKYMATKLSLKNIATLNIDVSKLKDQDINCAICRGLGSLTKTLLLTRKSFSPKASFYHLKGPQWSNEIGELPSQLLSVCKPELLGDYKLSNNLGDRVVVRVSFR